MPRMHAVYDVELGKQIDMPFTPEEEKARDLEEERNRIKQAAIDALETEKTTLLQKLAADQITQAEIRQLLRLERGL